MALKNYKPITPSLRQLVIVDRDGPVEGQAGEGADRAARRRPAAATTTAASPATTWAAATSSACAWSTSSAASSTSPATVERLEYDPNRSAFIALIKYARRRAGLHPGAAAPEGGRRGRVGRAGRRQAGQRHAACQHAGRHHRAQRRDEEGQGGQLARSAGTYAQLVGKDAGYAQIKLNSGELRLVPGECLATRRRGLATPTTRTS